MSKSNISPQPLRTKVSVVLATESLEEGAEDLVEEAAEAHPEVVEVPADDPGGGEES